MNKQSNLYVLLYTVALTVICGLLLAFASEGLKPFKEANIAYDLKKNILATTMNIEGKSQKEIEGIYDKQVKPYSYVINAKGEKVEGKSTEDINVSEEYSKSPSERLLPVYEIRNADDTEKITSYVLPVYGFGLWDNIWGYVALKDDLNTIQGAIFAHRGETPGLGARIANTEIQKRYEDKKLFDDGEFKSVMMMKGEGVEYESPYQVDGMSGATITGQGVNKMLVEYLGTSYKPFLESKRKTVSLR